jgi:hypothetical protein
MHATTVSHVEHEIIRAVSVEQLMRDRGHRPLGPSLRQRERAPSL